MADDHHNELTAARVLITTLYAYLADTCRRLPIPVTLPTLPDLGSRSTPVAVWRAGELADSQPMPHAQARELYTACALWAAAAEMYGTLRTDYQPWRLAATLAATAQARAALDSLSAWLQREHPGA